MAASIAELQRISELEAQILALGRLVGGLMVKVELLEKREAPRGAPVPEVFQARRGPGRPRKVT